VFDLKIVSGTGQIEGAGGKGSKKNWNSCHPLNHGDNFLSNVQVVKNTKIIFCLPNIAQDKINLFNTFNFIMWCSVLYYFIQYLYLANQTDTAQHEKYKSFASFLFSSLHGLSESIHNSKVRLFSYNFCLFMLNSVPKHLLTCKKKWRHI
jgi:hypothetical protein